MIYGQQEFDVRNMKIVKNGVQRKKHWDIGTRFCVPMMTARGTKEAQGMYEKMPEL